MSLAGWPIAVTALVLGCAIIVFRKPYSRLLAHLVSSAPTAPFGLAKKGPAFWTRFTVVGASLMMVAGVAIFFAIGLAA